MATCPPHSATSIDEDFCKCDKCGITARHEWRSTRYMHECVRCHWTVFKGKTEAERAANLEREIRRFPGNR